MSGYGGWTNPNGSVHYIRPGDQIVQMGTNFQFDSACYSLDLAAVPQVDAERAAAELVANRVSPEDFW